MAVFKHKKNGRLLGCPEPDDGPQRRRKARAAQIARYDGSYDYERVDGGPGKAKQRPKADDSASAQPDA
jgi:hypothetical protein